MAGQAPEDQGPKKPLLARLTENVTVSAVGLEVGFSVAIGALAGYWLDGKLDTGPWLTLVGLAFGVAAAAKRLIEITRQLTRDERDGKGGSDDNHNG